MANNKTIYSELLKFVGLIIIGITVAITVGWSTGVSSATKQNSQDIIRIETQYMERFKHISFVLERHTELLEDIRKDQLERAKEGR